VPAGFTRAGMPIGMQLLARPFAEATLFACGHAYQKATDFHLKAP
jgi:aspartyl-tRNA(Asn)/glutamyl-tRNA(Gln) amidotransferase subunit A